MQIIRTEEALRSTISALRQQNKTIGFTPTMGALHQGHVSLVKASIKDSDVSVCSIFVNPTQFNESSDLDKYPRTFEEDSNMLKDAGLDILFFPPVDVVYPKELYTNIDLDFEGLDEKMEGEFRPGHFKGVAQVVRRFIDLVSPDKLYMGQKDFQQFSIIDFMIKKLKLKTSLVVCPTIREKDGLAMSSRNKRLDPNIRKKAGIIYDTLGFARDNLAHLKVSDIRKQAMRRIAIPNFKPEYFEIINGRTLKSLNYAGSCKYVVACTAVWGGNIRLIDNMILKKLD